MAKATGGQKDRSKSIISDDEGVGKEPMGKIF
jgi:hypothetical protein